MLAHFDSYVYDFEERTIEEKITKMFLFSGVHTERITREAFVAPWQHTLGRKTQELTVRLGHLGSWSLAELGNAFFTPP